MENTKPAESAELKIEVGKSYRTRTGDRVTIVGTKAWPSEWPFEGDNESTYTPNGRASADVVEDPFAQDVHDLIAEWEGEPHPAEDTAWMHPALRPDITELPKHEGISTQPNTLNLADENTGEPYHVNLDWQQIGRRNPPPLNISMTIDNTLEWREKRYGEFTERARITQRIKRAYLDSNNWEQLPDYMKDALEMTAHKIGRILNGDPNYVDSWHDIIGYIRLVEQELEKRDPVPDPTTYGN